MLPIFQKIPLLILSLYVLEVSGAEIPSDYKLGAGDQIRITVYDEPELSMEVRLSDAGTISYPFLGDIQVLGKSVAELEQRIRDGLKGDYLVEPEVSISILEYRPFFVHGEAGEPGGFPYVPGITLRKAIALAGGFTERASRRKFQVIRDGATGSREIGLDDLLQPGDIITVEQSFFEHEFSERVWSSARRGTVC